MWGGGVFRKQGPAIALPPYGAGLADVRVGAAGVAELFGANAGGEKARFEGCEFVHFLGGGASSL